MTYYIFDTEADALSVEQHIVDNVRAWVTVNVPEALSEDGQKLRGRNAATGEFVDVYTTKWAIPMQTSSGQWVIEKPTAEKTAPIPVEVFLADVAAEEVEYDSAWFLFEEESTT
jgi:hypothetical protein